MGQKTHPVGFRLILSRKWLSDWFAPKKKFSGFLLEDFHIRRFLSNSPLCNGSSAFLISRMGGRLEIIIRTSRPGLVIGKKGSDIESLKSSLRKLTGKKDIWIEVEEIKNPVTDAAIIAKSIANQLERRVMFRKVIKKSIMNAMEVGVLGIKVQCSGRLGGADIARTEWYKEGKISLQTLRYDIDYYSTRAETTYGCLGIKVWVAKGDGLSLSGGKK